MPLCGLKKSKQQKRDSSPPFERKPPDAEVEGLHRQITEFEKKNESLRKELENKDGELAMLRRENKDLRNKLDVLKNEAEEAKSARDGDLVMREEEVQKGDNDTGNTKLDGKENQDIEAEGDA